MTPNSEIINWDNIFSKSSEFQTNTPFQFAFIENWLQKDFYEKLYETYPKIDDSWTISSDLSRLLFYRLGPSSKPNVPELPGDDPTLSKYWNQLKKTVESPEFCENFTKFSGVKVNRLKYFEFIEIKQGGFQLPHIHDVGPNTLILLMYFSKNWKHGSPGGTYMASELDESSIIFEPYNLDNSFAIFHDSPKAAHGVRYITDDVQRRALQIELEYFSEDTGWSGDAQTMA